MWECPNCGRQFHTKNQHHYCEDKPQTVDEYILGFDQDKQEKLQLVRRCLQEALPDAIEKISWRMPTYWKGHNIVHFAGQKRHIGLYPGAEAVAQFAEVLDTCGYKYSKGTIQIPYSKELPLELIREIAQWCDQ